MQAAPAGTSGRALVLELFDLALASGLSSALCHYASERFTDPETDTTQHLLG